MRIHKAVVLLGLAAIFVWGIAASDEPIKVGVVDLDQALISTDEGKKASDEIQRKQKEAEAQVQPLVEKYKALEEEIKSKKFSPGLTVTGPKGSVFVPINKAVNGRWLLASKDRAEKMGLKDGMLVDVRVGADSDWATTFHKVLVIIEGEDRWALYLDPDAASAASVKPGDWAQVLLP